MDGVERSLSNLDPNEIETFSILKDASATASTITIGDCASELYDDKPRTAKLAPSLPGSPPPPCCTFYRLSYLYSSRLPLNDVNSLSVRALPSRHPEQWMADPGCGYTVQTDVQLWMRDRLVEAIDIVPFGYADTLRGQAEAEENEAFE